MSNLDGGTAEAAMALEGDTAEAPMALEGGTAEAAMALEGGTAEAAMALEGGTAEAAMALEGGTAEAPMALEGGTAEAAMALEGGTAEAAMALEGGTAEAAMALEGGTAEAPMALEGGTAEAAMALEGGTAEAAMALEGGTTDAAMGGTAEAAMALEGGTTEAAMGGTAEAAMAPSRCSICLEEVIYGGRRSSAKLQCNHEFHLDCIGSEFNMKGAMRCPNCRHVEKDGDWRYTNGRNDPPASALEIDDPFMDNQVIILEDLLEIDGFHLIPSFTTVNRRLRTDIDYYLSEIHRPIASSAYGAANALRENVTSSQGPSSSTAHNCNAISSQTHTLNTAEIYTPIDIRTDAAIHAESNQIFEPFAETYNMLGHATNPNSHAWVHPFQAHMQNGSFDSVSVPGTTTRATLNGLPNYSAAYSYSSAQNGRFHGLNLNNPPVYYASNPPQYGYPVSMPARTTRAMLNGQPNYSAAYSYPSGQNGRFHGLNLNNPPYYHASNPPQNGYRVSVHARTTRARLNGQQNYSAAYSYPSAQNGSFYGLNLNNLPYYHASNPPQNGYAASVHARTTRARLDGTENHSAAAYSYPSAQNGRLNLNNLPGSHASNPPHNGYVVSVLGVQHGSLEAVSEPRTSMTMFNSPNPTGMSNIHHFQQTYRSNARRAAESSTDLSLSIGSHHRAQEELHDAFQDNRNIFPHGPPTRVMRQPSHFGSSGTNSASTIHAQMTPYHRPPTALRRHAPRTDTLGTARNTMNNRQNDRRQNQH